MSRILIVGNPESPLVRERGLAGQAAGHEIFWFSLKKIDIPGVEAFGLPGALAGSKLLAQVLQPTYFRKALSNIKPDLIHVHYAFKGLLALSLGCFHPLMVTAMGSDISPDGAYRGLLKSFTRHLLDRADCITIKSESMRETLKKIGDYGHKTETITWGVDLELFTPTRQTQAFRERLQIPPKTLVIFDPRAARPLYNKHILVDAFGVYLRKGGPDAVLLISEFNASNGYLRDLKGQVKELKLEKQVRFLPPQSKEGMADLYTLADIVVSIPSSDGFPQTIYEAWATGRFLVLSDLSQYRAEFQDGGTAKLVEKGSVDKLAEALVWVARHPEIRQAAKENGRRRAEAIGSKTEQIARVNQLYARMLGKQ